MAETEKHPIERSTGRWPFAWWFCPRVLDESVLFSVLLISQVSAPIVRLKCGEHLSVFYLVQFALFFLILSNVPTSNPRLPTCPEEKRQVRNPFIYFHHSRFEEHENLLDILPENSIKIKFQPLISPMAKDPPTRS